MPSGSLSQGVHEYAARLRRAAAKQRDSRGLWTALAWRAATMQHRRPSPTREGRIPAEYLLCHRMAAKSPGQFLADLTPGYQQPVRPTPVMVAIGDAARSFSDVSEACV